MAHPEPARYDGAMEVADMVRTQIELTDEQHRRLQIIARREGITLAEAVRRCLDRSLSAPEGDLRGLYARAAELIGTIRAPEDIPDLAEHHDRYLEESLE